MREIQRGRPGGQKKKGKVRLMGGNKTVGDRQCSVISFLGERRGWSGVFGKCSSLKQPMSWQGGRGAPLCLLTTVKCSACREPYSTQQAGKAPVCKHSQVLPHANLHSFANCLPGGLRSPSPLAHRQGKPSHAQHHPPAPAPLALRAWQELVWSIQVGIKIPILLLAVVAFYPPADVGSESVLERKIHWSQHMATSICQTEQTSRTWSQRGKTSFRNGVSLELS